MIKTSIFIPLTLLSVILLASMTHVKSAPPQKSFPPGQSGASCNQSAVARKYLLGLFGVPKDITVLDRYAKDPAYNHNPLAADGVANLRAALSGLEKNFNYIRILKIATQGYYTFVHSKYYLDFNTFAPAPAEPGVSVVDIFLFTPDCKIIEHWDVNQKAVFPNVTASGNDMFKCVTCTSLPQPIPSSCDSLTSAKTFLLGAFNQKNVSIVEKYVNHDIYVQHNPNIDNGIDAIEAAIATLPTPSLGPLLRNIRGIADGNFVYLHNKYFFGDVPTAAVDIFRFDSNCTMFHNCTIVEHWDVLQITPSHTISGNDMFACLGCESEWSPYTGYERKKILVRD